MSLFKVFNIASSAMTAQSHRLNVVASNLSNADSVTNSSGEPYRGRQVIFSTLKADENAASGVRVAGVVHDPSPMRKIFEPHHPFADKDGYIIKPNVNVVDEMVNMMSASRSYQNNVDIMNTTKSLLQKTLTIGQ